MGELSSGPRLRVARHDDVPALRELIPLSARVLSRGHYTEKQIRGAVRYVFGVDTQLVEDGTYFVVEVGGRAVGCGGWSRRRTLYGGDQAKDGEDPLLDPATEAARIRAFFVHPDAARRGIGSQLMRACFEAARDAGFRRLELMATLPGVPLYEAFGFRPLEEVDAILPDGTRIGFVRMGREIETPRP